MIIKRTAFILGSDQPTDQVIPFGTGCAALGYDNLYDVIERFGSFHRGTTRGGGFFRINLRAGKDRQRPGSILFDLVRTILRKADQGIDNPNRKIQGKVHQIAAFARHQRLDVFLANNPIDLGFFPAVDSFRHEHRLQQVANVLVRVSIHRSEDQPVKKSAQAFSDKTTGEVAGIAHYCHDIVVFEQGERRTVGVQAGDARHPQTRHEVLFKNRRIHAHLAVYRMKVHIASTIVAGDVRERLAQIVPRLCRHCSSPCYCSGIRHCV